jgi:photosystem II stability/assembly factor-like uncharacterized protein
VSHDVSWALAIQSATGVRCGFTVDGGVTWNPKVVGAPFPSDIFFFDSTFGWLVSDDGLALPKSGGLSWTQDAGKTWSLEETCFAGKPEHIRFSDRDRGFVAVSAPNETKDRTFSKLLTTPDGGHTWRKTGFFEKRILDALIVSDERFFVVGEEGLIAMSRDGGITWTEQVTYEIPSAINGIAFYDDQLGIAVGDDGLILISENAGLNWERIDEGNGSSHHHVSAHFTSRTGGVLVSSTEIFLFRIRTL